MQILIAQNRENNKDISGPDNSYVTNTEHRIIQLEESEKRIKKRLTNYISLYKNCTKLLKDSQQ